MTVAGGDIEALLLAIRSGGVAAVQRLIDEPLRRVSARTGPEIVQGTPLDAANESGTHQDNVIGWLREQGACSQNDG